MNTTFSTKKEPSWIEKPTWIENLISVGESADSIISENRLNKSETSEYALKSSTKSRLITVALCLPRIDFSAILVALGVIKNQLKLNAGISDRNKLHKLIGNWVSYQPPNTRPVVGVLEYNPDENEETRYSIRLYAKTPAPESMTVNEWQAYTPPSVKASWQVVLPKYYNRVYATGKKFNSERRVGKNQISKLYHQNKSLASLGDLLESDFTDAVGGSHETLVYMIANKSRVSRELKEPLIKGDPSTYLEEVIRPKWNPQFEKSYLTEILPAHPEILYNLGKFVIIESSRSTADHLRATRNCNRILLLPRNAAHYEDSSNILLGEFSLHNANSFLLNTSAQSAAIIIRSFYHK